MQLDCVCVCVKVNDVIGHLITLDKHPGSLFHFQMKVTSLHFSFQIKLKSSLNF